MSDIFISYASEDKAKAKALADALEQQNWSVWWDRNIPPGRSFDEVIEEAIDSAKCVIVLWSSASVKSDWVKTEAAEGKRRGILVPVLVEDVTIPLEFRRIQAADLANWQGASSDLEFAELLQAVSIMLDATVTRDRTPERLRLPKAPRKSPESPEAHEGWHAELVSTGWVERTIRVYLAQDYHVIEFRYYPMRFKNFDIVKVDGSTVAEGGTGVAIGKRKLNFHITYGTKRYPAIVEVSTTWRESIGNFRLSIAGRVLYNEEA